MGPEKEHEEEKSELVNANTFGNENLTWKGKEDLSIRESMDSNIAQDLGYKDDAILHEDNHIKKMKEPESKEITI